MASSTNTRLRAQQARLQRLASELATTGFISQGSVVQRYMPCGKPGCRCQADPPQLHGPYWQWTRAVGGKTVTRRLTEAQARLYKEWIANRRRLTKIMAQMEKVSEQAADLLLNADDHSLIPPAGSTSTPARPTPRITRQLAETLIEISELLEPLTEAAQLWLDARNDDDRQAVIDARDDLKSALASTDLRGAGTQLARLSSPTPASR